MPKLFQVRGVAQYLTNFVIASIALPVLHSTVAAEMGTTFNDGSYMVLMEAYSNALYQLQVLGAFIVLMWTLIKSALDRTTHGFNYVQHIAIGNLLLMAANWIEGSPHKVSGSPFLWATILLLWVYVWVSQSGRNAAEEVLCNPARIYYNPLRDLTNQPEPQEDI